MVWLIKIALYASLGFLLGQQNITISDTPWEFILIVANVIVIDYFAGNS
jgi:hypothetical protein